MQEIDVDTWELPVQDSSRQYHNSKSISKESLSSPSSQAYDQNLTDLREYGFPIQFHLPYENGIQASFTHVSLPRSDSIHRSGMKELGFEKYRSSCNIVQVGQLTTVYNYEICKLVGYTFPRMKRPPMVIPSGGVTRGGVPEAIGRIRSTSKSIEDLQGDHFHESQHREIVIGQLIDH